MRLNLFRSGGTLRYDADGNAIWYVVDEDAPGAQKYEALRCGTIVECAKYIQEREAAEIPRTVYPNGVVIQQEGN